MKVSNPKVVASPPLPGSVTSLTSRSEGVSGTKMESAEQKASSYKHISGRSEATPKLGKLDSSDMKMSKKERRREKKARKKEARMSESDKENRHMKRVQKLVEFISSDVSQSDLNLSTKDVSSRAAAESITECPTDEKLGGTAMQDGAKGDYSVEPAG